MAVNNKGSENMQQNEKKNTAAGGYGRTLRVVCLVLL
jgi:hypothetical protein